MVFEIVDKITHIETIAVEGSIKDINRLRKTYGMGRWPKRKGIAMVRLANGNLWKAESNLVRGIGHRQERV